MAGDNASCRVCVCKPVIGNYHSNTSCITSYYEGGCTAIVPLDAALRQHLTKEKS